MKHAFLIIITVFLSVTTIGQSYDANHPPNTYASQQNSLYWKNKMPRPGYWQQDVHYQMDVTLNTDSNVITGNSKLTYWNNSPDTLNAVYFHLYQNAFQPESYASDLAKANKIKHRYGAHEKEKKGTVVRSLKVENEIIEYQLDNTVLKVQLPSPLLPDEKVTFDINFTTYFDQGTMGRRMAIFSTDEGYKHFNGVHWYPRIAVYDHKFGWTTDQHLGKEFYGDFGTFDVSITLPHEYIMDATGTLQNEDEVLPEALKQKLDIKNFKDKPWGSPASQIIAPEQGKVKTWKFYAENVHDFAFTADPTYRIGTAEWNGIKTVALVQESHAAGWQNAAELSADIIKVYSRDFGIYEYPKIIVADARDGMEYPMLTLDNGATPGYTSLLAHEIGHNWFFGMLGNNETYRAAMDEGFTQFLTAWYMTHWDSTHSVTKKGYAGKHRKKHSEPYHSAMYGYYAHVLRGDDARLNTHSDDFEGALGHGGGYSLVYYKQATMLYNLQYVLGDSLFSLAMRNYVAQWKMAHPYPEDFRASVIQTTGVDLNWFFDQWLETEKTVDYGIRKVKKLTDSTFAITFERHGEMQMPLDFTITTRDNEQLHYSIPNTWFEKPVKNVTHTERWVGWGKLNKEHTVTVSVPNGISSVQIDPSGRLADVNQLNNATEFPLSVSFDNKLHERPDVSTYELNIAPDIWYNSFDGIKLGMRFQGDYMDRIHKTDIRLWSNTTWARYIIPALDQNLRRADFMSYDATYTTPLNKKDYNEHLFIESRFIAGQLVNQIGLTHWFDNEKSYIEPSYKSLYRPNAHSDNYLIYPSFWMPGEWNNSLNLVFGHKYRFTKGNGSLEVAMRSTAFGDADYQYIQATSLNDISLWRFDVKQRFFGQLGTGSNFAQESMLYSWGANPEEMSSSKFYRAVSLLPREMTQFGTVPNSYQMGGGLNLRGYSGYFSPELTEDGFLTNAFQGHSGWSANTEIEFQRLVSLRMPKIQRYVGLKTYLFGDVGMLYNNSVNEKFNPSALRADAGIGTLLTIKKFGAFETFNPLNIRFDMPLFLNRLPAGETEYVAFRWLLGIERCF